MSENTFLQRASNPFIQSGICLAIVMILNVLGSGFQSVNEGDEPSRFPWLVITAMMLFYALFNVIFSLSSNELQKYWSKSLYGYMLLAGLGGLMAWAISGVSIGEAGSYKWMYIVVTFSYLVFISIVSLARKVVDFAQKEEWNAPKMRQKKRRR